MEMKLLNGTSWFMCGEAKINFLNAAWVMILNWKYFEILNNQATIKELQIILEYVINNLKLPFSYLYF